VLPARQRQDRRAVTRPKVDSRTAVRTSNVRELADVDLGELATCHPAHGAVIMTRTGLPGLLDTGSV
jgi:hypothetical protein